MESRQQYWYVDHYGGNSLLLIAQAEMSMSNNSANISQFESKTIMNDYKRHQSSCGVPDLCSSSTNSGLSSIVRQVAHLPAPDTVKPLHLLDTSNITTSIRSAPKLYCVNTDTRTRVINVPPQLKTIVNTTEMHCESSLAVNLHQDYRRTSSKNTSQPGQAIPSSTRAYHTSLDKHHDWNRRHCGAFKSVIHHPAMGIVNAGVQSDHMETSAFTASPKRCKLCPMKFISLEALKIHYRDHRIIDPQKSLAAASSLLSDSLSYFPKQAPPNAYPFEPNRKPRIAGADRPCGDTTNPSERSFCSDPHFGHDSEVRHPRMTQTSYRSCTKHCFHEARSTSVPVLETHFNPSGHG